MSETRPAVSVILPAWGVAHLVGEALASLQAQTFRDWEAIVIDDGAPDDVAGAVAPFVAADPRIHFLATENGGLSAARNRAIAASRAPLIALLDGDDQYRPDYLERMVAAIRAAPDLGIVSCDATYSGQPSRKGRRFSEYHGQAATPTLAALLDRSFNVFVAAILRREAFDATGGFDETLPAAEDFDMWLRIVEQGWRIAQVPEPLAIYRRRPGSLSSATRQLRLATARVYEKAVERLAGRPEAAIAAAMMEQMRREAGWAEGEELVMTGRTSAGLKLLHRHRAGARSPRWRMMMGLFRAVPPLAGPVLRWRRRREADI
ncbi:glycosyltransferase family 2 protein [Sphingomonas sp. PR090111-T3T-6A]|uniref:glycosyltransferase family 2 protein n=1 Tax=Sphingomonas sp. PR090111-T3T-6A TaxID=685778 RepID=UPI00036F7B55|nr:glycosyltransferase family A protein [Sphingomonas sp. PR090111-T3T-6A]